MRKELKLLFNDVGLLVLRVSFGLMLALGHGWGKFQRLGEIGSPDFSWPDPIGVGMALSLILAAFGEFVCGLLVALGLFTRLTALPAFVTMMVAAFLVHAKRGDPFFATGQGGSMEMAMLFGMAFLTIVLAGPGRFSLDRILLTRLLRKRKKD